VTVNGVSQTFTGLDHLNVFGLGGDDTIVMQGLTIDISADGGAGNDRLIAAGVTGTGVTLIGGAGADLLIGGAAADRLEGGEGSDTVFGGAGNDTITGGDGADVVVWSHGDGSDTVDGGAGVDLVALFGSASRDDFSVRANGTHVDVSVNGGGLDLDGIERLSIWSGSGADTIRIGNLAGTTLGFIEVDAGSGNDVVDGSATAATLCVDGGSRDDKLLGGSGNDLLDGGAGDDTLVGGAGNDVLLGGPGRNVLRGGDGNDVLVGGGGNDALFGDAGDDTLIGGGGRDTLIGGAGKDTLIRGSGKDTLIDKSRPTACEPRIDWAGKLESAIHGCRDFHAPKWIRDMECERESHGKDDLDDVNSRISVLVNS